MISKIVLKFLIIKTKFNQENIPKENEKQRGEVNSFYVILFVKNIYLIITFYFHSDKNK